MELEVINYHYHRSAYQQAVQATLLVGMHLTRNSKSIRAPNWTHADSRGPTDLDFTSQTLKMGPNRSGLTTVGPQLGGRPAARVRECA